MLKKVLIALAALILIFVVVVALQPSEFHVERSATIAAPQDEVFAQVNDFRKWDAWSPWAKLDPQAKIAFEGPPSGEGTVMTWAGNDKVGEGKMTLDESRPSDLVKIKVDFVRPFEGSNTSQFTFKPDGDRTSVTWTMDARHNFFEKAFCLIMNGKKMVGDDMEKGLTQMKSVAESGS
ncbi:MAG: SRPBCC family protein [Alphaproteobacteria bacterium]|nr:SRPBCC family protein [Alphaproteobacteria bacterium]